MLAAHILITTAALLLTQAAPAVAQTTTGKAAEVPTHLLTFNPDVAPITGITVPEAYAYSLTSAGSGGLLLSFTHPVTPAHPEPVPDTLVLIRDRTAIPIDTASIRDIDIEQVENAIPASTSIALAVRGRHRSAAGTGKLPTTTFVAFFTRAGQYERSVELPAALEGSVLAILPSGDLLVADHDFTSRQDTVGIYDRSGTLIRPLDQPMTAREREPFGPQPNPSQAVTHGDNVVLYRLGTRNAVLEIGEADVIREIPLALPPGVVIAGMLPSDSTLIVESFPGWSVGKALHSADATWYEFDPLDGRLIRVFRNGTLAAHPVSKSGDEITAIGTDKDHHFIHMTAH